MSFKKGTSGNPKMVLHDYTYALAHTITAKLWHNVVGDGGLHFTIADTETLFTGDFTGAECLRIFCYFPDGLPNLRVRCINRNGDRECWYLTESGRDGSLMLLDESALHLADEDDDSF